MGNRPLPGDQRKVIAVAGGTGLAAVYQLARDYGGCCIFLLVHAARIDCILSKNVAIVLMYILQPMMAVQVFMGV